MAVLNLVYSAISAIVFMSDTGAQIALEEERKLQVCLEQMEKSPTDAYEYGLAWLSEGSRPFARYCTALALIEIGNAAEGAARLEALANAPDGGSISQRATYLAQSGNAWLVAGLPEEAIVTLSNAIKLTPNDPTLFIDRARAHLLLENWADGEADLDHAIAAQPDTFDGYYLRSQARLNLEKYDAALSDVSNARAIDPENIDILVIRGDIREEMRLKGLR